MAEVEARDRFRERVGKILSSSHVTIEALTGQLRREGYSRDMLPRALNGVGVHVDGEGRATMEPGPRQSRLR